VRIVVGDEDAPSSIVPVDLGPIRGTMGAEERERDDEFAALSPALAVSLDRAAVQLDEPLGEREPEAEPMARLAGSLLSLHEHLEDSRQDRCIDADAAVGDAHASLVGGGTKLDADPSAGFGVLRRIREDVRQSLREPHMVAVDADRRG